MAKTPVYKPNNSNYSGGYQNSSVSNVNSVPYSLTSLQIGAQAGAVGATTTLYTVPQGFTLFITSCTLEAINQNGAGIYERSRLYFQGQLIMRLYSGLAAVNDAVANSMSFPFPYILRGGENVYIQSESLGGLSQGSIVGFLVRNEDLFIK